MLLSRVIANFTRGESDALRKAMGKKLIEKLNHMYPKFIKGGTANGYDPKVLEKIWEDWRAFASYAFNKSHATCYSWVAYQTAYLKANYPAQYMAGVMSRSLADIKTITKLMDESKSMGISTLGPDINESRVKFSVNALGEIRFGLGAVKGVGEAAVDAILSERKKNGPYQSVYDFIERINFLACNKKCVESLALAGAFDGFGTISREQFFSTCENGNLFLDELVAYGQNYQADKANATASLFDDIAEIEITKPQPPKIYAKWSAMERLNKERDLIGIYISGHPLDDYAVILNRVCNLRAAELDRLDAHANEEVTLGGIVNLSREGQTRTGKPYGIFRVEDYSGTGEIALFGDDWAKWRGYIVNNSTLFITARVEPKRWDPTSFELRIGNIEFLSDVKDRKIESLTVGIRLEALDDKTTNDLSQMLKESNGPVALFFKILDGNTQSNVLLQATGRKISIKKTSWITLTRAMRFRMKLIDNFVTG